jgi:predicted O-methyltransferase YrrM
MKSATTVIPGLYEMALQHLLDHGCSAHPYQEYEKLIEAVNFYAPRKVLEIGAGIGFTAAAMLLSNRDIYVDTFEKDSVHAKLARKLLNELGFWQRSAVINDSAEIALPLLQTKYDFIFFDGFQIHYEFLPQYKRLLNREGILFLANNHLKSKTSDRFFAELADATTWKIIDQFADTTVAQRL